jgi:hypothetical protein
MRPAPFSLSAPESRHGVCRRLSPVAIQAATSLMLSRPTSSLMIPDTNPPEADQSESGASEPKTTFFGEAIWTWHWWDVFDGGERFPANKRIARDGSVG